MIKGLVFLDIDGTLIDSNYQSNSKELPHLIADLQNKNYIFVLNSNRALEDLTPIAKQFNIDGLLVCENGCYIYNQREDKKLPLMDDVETNKVIEFKKEYENFVKKIATKLNKRIIYKLADTVKSVTEKNDITKSKDKPGTVYFLDNIYRKYTISSHVKEYDGIKLQKNLEILELFYNSIKNEIETSEYKEFLTVSYSNDFGNILIYPSCTSKTMGVKYIVQKYFDSNVPVLAIGDETNDYKMIDGFGSFWTVYNASIEVKELASKVATNKYSSGVFELLKEFANEQ